MWSHDYYKLVGLLQNTNFIGFHSFIFSLFLSLGSRPFPILIILTCFSFVCFRIRNCNKKKGRLTLISFGTLEWCVHFVLLLIFTRIRCALCAISHSGRLRNIKLSLSPSSFLVLLPAITYSAPSQSQSPDNEMKWKWKWKWCDFRIVMASCRFHAAVHCDCCERKKRRYLLLIVYFLILFFSLHLHHHLLPLFNSFITFLLVTLGIWHSLFNFARLGPPRTYKRLIITGKYPSRDRGLSGWRYTTIESLFFNFVVVVATAAAAVVLVEPNWIRKAQTNNTFFFSHRRRRRFVLMRMNQVV